MIRCHLQTVFIFAVLASSVLSAEFIVSSLGDSGPGTLRDAVEQANATEDADTIRFDFSALPGGGQRMINLSSGGLVISHDVDIIGPGRSDLVVQRSMEDGTPEFRIFDVSFGDKTVGISSMTIRNGTGTVNRGGGALATSVGNKVRLHDTVVEGNTTAASQAGSGGGAIFNAGELTITSSVFSNNSVSMPTEDIIAGGGAIFNAGTLNVSKTVFSANMATDGTGSEFHYGGAIFNNGNATLTVNNSSFDGNQVSALGGAIFNNVGGTVRLNNNTISGNGALDGGGVFNLGSIEELKSNIINGNQNNPFAGGNFPDLGLGKMNGTIGIGVGNIVGHSNGHGLDPATNQFGVDPQLGPLQNNGGPTPSLRPDPDTSPAKDKGDNSLGLRFDQRGFFRTLEGGTDVGAAETGNRVFIPSDQSPAAWSDPDNWLAGNVPVEGDPAWIVGANTADVTDAGQLVLDSLNVGVSGDVGRADGAVVGSDVSITVDTVDIGSAYGAQSPINSGSGDVSLTNVSVSSNNVLIGVSESAGSAVYTTAHGNLSITNDSGGASTLSVAGNAGGGSALAFVADSKANAHGMLQFNGQSASFGGLFAGEALSSDGGRATTVTQVQIAASEDVETGTVSAATALSGPNSRSVVKDADISITADRFIVNGPVHIGMAQISGPADSAPQAEVSGVWYATTANDHSIAGRLSLAAISASTFGPSVAKTPMARVGTARVDITTGALAVNSGLEIAPIFATGNSDNTIDEARLTIIDSDTEISGSVAVGTMFLSDTASGVINNATLEIVNGTFRVLNTPSGVSSLRIGTVDAFTPAGLAQTTAAARFVDVVVEISSDVEVANTNVAGADPASSVHAILDLENSQVSVSGDVILGETEGVATIGSSVAMLRLNPSLLLIDGDLRMGDAGVLSFLIEGVERPAPGFPGEYGAIDAAGAAFDGQLLIDVDFPAVAEGDRFELVRVEPGGAISGNFDSVVADGLPAGFGIQTLVTGDGFFAEVISILPPVLAGDTNGDGVVNLVDFNYLKNTFGSDDPFADFNKDGRVDLSDFAILKENFGASTAASVPEPSTTVLLIVGSMAGILLPRRRVGSDLP